MSKEQVISELKQRLGTRCFPEEPFTRGIQTFMRIDKECLKDAIGFLKNNEFTHLSAITGFEVEDGIELLYHLSNRNTLLTIRIKLPKNEAVASSITNVIRGATLYEQEIHDLLGVKFAGHPNLERLILPDDWPADNYPLRKSRTPEKGKKRKRS
ncbi:MAG: NADH-quinone oxidoreductase subunit C [Candidatus Bathyarchaeia archaeon]